MYKQLVIDFGPEEMLDYLRKSRSDDPLLTVEEVLSKHESILDDWAIKHLGKKIPESNKYREVVSGETLKDRPEVQEVLRRIESPRIRAVAVVEPQRLTRGDLEDIGRLMKLFKHTDTLIVTPERIYDLRDDYDWEAFERELKRGNDYLEYSKKILNRGKLLSVSQGNYIGSVPPYGYDKVTVLDGKRKCPTLKENPEQANVVRMMFDLYVNAGYGPHRICKRMEELGIKPPKGKYWSPYWVQEVFANPHYIGKVKWNWRKSITIVDDGEFIKKRPKADVSEYLLFEGRHEGIVSEEIFNAAQARRGKTPRVNMKAPIANPLAGIVRCSCGRAMTMQTYARPNQVPRLLCPDHLHCHTGSCVFEDVMERVCQILRDCIEDFEVRVKNNEGDSVKLHANLIASLEKKLDDLKAKEIAQWDQQSHPDESQRMPPQIFKLLNEKVLKEKEELQRALCEAYESMPKPVDYEEKKHTFQDALAALQDPDADIMKKNTLLKQCFEEIVYKRERPQRIKGKGTKGTPWTNPPIELEVTLKI